MKDDTLKNTDSETMDTPEEKKELDTNWAHDALQELEDRVSGNLHPPVTF